MTPAERRTNSRRKRDVGRHSAYRIVRIILLLGVGKDQGIDS